MNFWSDRSARGRLHWLTLDLAEVVALRRQVPGGYRPPEWTWTVDADEVRRLRELPGLTDLREVPQAGGDRLLGVLRRVPGLKNRLPVIPVFQARLGHGAARDSAARDSAAQG